MRGFLKDRWGFYSIGADLMAAKRVSLMEKAKEAGVNSQEPVASAMAEASASVVDKETYMKLRKNQQKNAQKLDKMTGPPMGVDLDASTFMNVLSFDVHDSSDARRFLLSEVDLHFS